MRNVPELRFDGFDEDWEEKKLSDIGKISAGGDVDKKKIKNKGLYPVIANGDSNDGIVGYYDDYYKISEPSVTISARGNIGTAVPRNYPFTPVIRVLTFISKNNIYFISEVINRLRIFNESSGVPQLTSPQFGAYKIFITKLSEQKKIGNLFRKLDTLIEIQEGKVTKMEDFKKSMLQKMFPKKGELVPEFRFDGFDGEWEKLTLGDIGEVQSSGVNKIIYNNQKIVKLLNYMDVYNKKSPTNSNIDTFMETSASDKEMLYKDVTKGDIFFTPTSETAEDIGHSMVVEDYIKGMVYSYHIFRFRPNSDVLDINFSDYFCNVDPVRKQLKIKAQGAQRYTLKLNDFRELIIKIPPLAEQQKIGQFFKNLDTQIENEEKLLESYKMMKKSLLQKMFV